MSGRPGYTDYVVEFTGGMSTVISVSEWEDLDIALAEQFTAYGDVSIDMVYPLTEAQA